MRGWAAMVVGVLGTVGACGPDWDLSEGFALSIDINPTEYVGAFTEKAIRASFSSAISQLGGTVSSSSTQLIKVAYMETCACSQCGPNTVAIAKPNTDTLFFCPKVKTNQAAFTDAGVKHELLHILAKRGDHLPCETGGMMAADLACAKSLGTYNQADRAYLCSAGVLGGICR